MDLIATPTDEQRQLADAAARYLRKAYGFATRQAIVAAGTAPSAHWRAFADFGWLALTLPEDAGGLAQGPAERAVLMEAFGRALVVEPYVESVVLGGGLLARLASGPQRELIASLAAGALQLALAHVDADGVATRAEPHDAGFRLHGTKVAAVNAPAADRLIVSARLRDEIALFLVPRDAPRLTLHGYATYDGLRAADVVLDGVIVAPADRLGATAQAAAALDDALDDATVALLAEALGAMAAAYELTVEYARTRKQFGRAIGEFQAVQHRIVDMFIALEEARSMVAYALDALARDLPPPTRRRAVSAAKVRVAECGRYVGQQAIQLHGAIGLTDEYAVGHYYKRLEAIAARYGDVEHHLARYGVLAAA